ncbi:MAG: MBL fold metallo-hydrolase [Ilumatobacteraceae bacterium]
METRVTEVADGIHQLTTHIPDIDFGFNQYVITGDEPLIFHTGMRGFFPLISAAVASVITLDTLRWVSFGHVEADECGAMNEFLAAAPQATVAQGATGCMVSIGDLADRAPRALSNGEVLDIGGHRIRWIDTPHVPHGWEAGVIFDETTGTLFCGDLFTRWSAYEATTTDDVLAPALALDATDDFGSWSLRPNSGDIVRQLAELDVKTLAPMHGSAFTGDCKTPLRGLATALDERIAR